MKNPLVMILVVGIIAIVVFAIYMANKTNKNIHSNLNYTPVGGVPSGGSPKFDIVSSVGGLLGLFGKKDAPSSKLSTTRPSTTFDSNGMMNTIQPKQFNF